MSGLLVRTDSGRTHTRVVLGGGHGAFLGFGRGGGCHPGRRPWPECVDHARRATAAGMDAAGAVHERLPPSRQAWPPAAAAALGAGLHGRAEPTVVWDNAIALGRAPGGAPGIVA